MIRRLSSIPRQLQLAGHRSPLVHSPGALSRRHPQQQHTAMPIHHLMIGTWTPPGAIFTVEFDDEKLTLKLVKRTEIPQDEPISWMTFDVRRQLAANWGHE